MGELWPSAGVAVPTGAKSGLVVLDADDAVEYVRRRGLEPDVYTPRGAHVYFLHPGFYVKSKNYANIYERLDIKGDGGYVLVHGPGRSGGVPDNPPELPEWVIAGMDDSPGAAQVGADVVPIISGSRNETLTSLAGTMRRRGMGERAIAQALLAENEERCVPPLPETEVRKIARSVSRYDLDSGVTGVTVTLGILHL